MTVPRPALPARLLSSGNRAAGYPILHPGNPMTKLIRTTLFVLFPLILAACSFSLAEDITPPPGAQQPVVQSSTSEAPTGPSYPLVPPDPAAGAADYA